MTNDRHGDDDARGVRGVYPSGTVIIGAMMGSGLGYSITMGYGLLHGAGMAVALGVVGMIGYVVYQAIVWGAEENV